MGFTQVLPFFRDSMSLFPLKIVFFSVTYLFKSTGEFFISRRIRD